MSASTDILLITGKPGISKTTVIKRVIQNFFELPMAVSTPKKIRMNNIRQRFALFTLQGLRYTMAHISISSRPRVGRYGVDVAAIERTVAKTLTTDGVTEVYDVDEIGKMECLSPLFVRRMTALLESGKPVLAIIAIKGGGFVAAVKTGLAQNSGRLPQKIATTCHQGLRRGSENSTFEIVLIR